LEKVSKRGGWVGGYLGCWSTGLLIIWLLVWSTN